MGLKITKHNIYHLGNVVVTFLDQIDAVQSVTNRVQIVVTGRWSSINLVFFVTSSDSKFQTIILNYLGY